MNKFISIIGVLIFSIMLVGCGNTPPAMNQGDEVAPFAFEVQEQDLGVVKQSGGIVEANFPFTYRGDTPITITNVVGSCACTEGRVDKTELNPRDSGALTVEFNPNLHAEPEGRFFKTVILLTDPPLKTDPEVKIWAEIDLDLGEEAFELQESHMDDHEEGYNH
jgi:hypothetical protein